MSPDYADWDLDGEVVFDRRLCERDLDKLQRLLGELAPKWSTRLRLWRGPSDQRPIALNESGALTKAVLAAVAERRPTYHKLVELYGRPEYERMVGSAELRGAGPELFVIISIDELVVSPLGDKKILGNSVSFQVRGPTIEGQPGEIWSANVFTSLCENLAPAWGCAFHPAEYWAKVMSESPGAEAIGRDFGRYLPGMFWRNFFGPRYQQLIGADRLRSAPAERVSSVGDGILLSLARDPREWHASEYEVCERQVRDHLGREYFFEKPKGRVAGITSRLQLVTNRLFQSLNNRPPAP